MLLAELHSAIRALRRSPRFTAIVVLVFTLGISANTLLFSVADAVVFRPFPFTDADRLVIAGEDILVPRSEITYRAFLAWRAQTQSLQDLTAIGSSNWSWNLRTSGETMRVRYRVVSANFFELLGAPRPLLGRTFSVDDDQRGATRTVILSHGFWQRQFGGDPSIVGRQIALSGTSFIVVGVMPRAFRYPADPDMWTPLVPELAAIAASIPNMPLDGGDVGVFVAIGRLKPGARPASVQVDLNRIIADQSRLNGRSRHVESRVQPLVDEILGSARARLASLLLAVALLLLVACANVAGLLVVRTASRSRELAVRVALGASPLALGRQLLWETLILAVGATAAAIAIGQALLPALVSLSPADIPRIGDAAVDARAVLFAAFAGFAAAIASAVFPALRMARGQVDLSAGLAGRAVTIGGLRNRFRRVVLVVELSAAVVLLAATGLLVRSVIQLQRLDLGFDPRQLFGVEMFLPERIGDAAARALLTRAADEVSRVPGVESLSAVSLHPLQGPIGLDSGYQLEEQSKQAAARNPYVNIETIGPSYFSTMRTRVVAGRAFTDDDRRSTAPVVIVSERFAALAWPGRSALGQRLQVAALDRAEPPAGIWWTVVGVVADIRYRRLESPGLTLYAPVAQSPDRAHELMIRTAALGSTPLIEIRERLRALNGNGVVRIDSMEEAVSTLQQPWRTNLILFGAFAALTGLIAIVGMYALLACTVLEQRREIGVRLVLGATRQRVALDILAAGGRVIAAGALLGLVVAAAVGRLMAAILFEVTSWDPVALVVTPALFAAVALAACAVPALRAARLEPADCLRAE